MPRAQIQIQRKPIIISGFGENFSSIAGKIQETYSETYKCIGCLKREKCKLEAQGSLDLCKRE